MKLRIHTDSDGVIEMVDENDRLIAKTVSRGGADNLAAAKIIVEAVNSIDRLQRAIHAAHGLIAPLGNQVTPSVMAIREATQILRNALR